MTSEPPYSIELEILDQILTGRLSLKVLRDLCPSDDRLIQAIHGLLEEGDIVLVTREGSEVSTWQWRALLREWRALLREGSALTALEACYAQITDQGANRIA